MLIITHHEDITRSHLKAGIFKNPKIISPQSNQESLHIKTPNNDEMNVEESVVNDLVEVCQLDKPIWRIIGFYGHPDRENREDSWNLLRFLAEDTSLPWFTIGDFNDLLNNDEKIGLAGPWKGQSRRIKGNMTSNYPTALIYRDSMVAMVTQGAHAANSFLYRDNISQSVFA
ncbi:hypothetical protein JHK84_044975 [Glycine max]|nr:hypothetical protein JHK84_044975 [Glycine max]